MPQDHADFALLPAKHAPQKEIVFLALMLLSYLLLDNAIHATTHAIHAALIYQFVTHA